MAANGRSATTRRKSAGDICGLSVEGFKSVEQQAALEIRPLTILAGANSSGKSSVVQPLLLLKQTLDSSYDPGPLLLNGPNVRFTQSDQLFSKRLGAKAAEAMTFGVDTANGGKLRLSFGRPSRKGGVDLRTMEFAEGRAGATLRAGMSHDEIAAAFPGMTADIRRLAGVTRGSGARLSVQRFRCFLGVGFEVDGRQMGPLPFQLMSPAAGYQDAIRRVIHVPGLRGNPARTYPTTSIGPVFQGTFENYVASVVASWQQQEDKRIQYLGEMLAVLGLTWKVEAKPVDDTQVELRVGRMPQSRVGGGKDLVSIADVGFGVSQTLPVLVALLAAETGRLVYIEQPEIHLHPKAQVGMAELLARAARRGVRVLVETHSALLLRRVQTLVAKGELASNLVRLHWFQRGADGMTEIRSGDLDRQGRLGEWPQDFGSIELAEDKEYLDAVEEAMRA